MSKNFEFPLYAVVTRIVDFHLRIESRFSSSVVLLDDRNANSPTQNDSHQTDRRRDTVLSACPLPPPPALLLLGDICRLVVTQLEPSCLSLTVEERASASDDSHISQLNQTCVVSFIHGDFAARGTTFTRLARRETASRTGSNFFQVNPFSVR